MLNTHSNIRSHTTSKSMKNYALCHFQPRLWQIFLVHWQCELNFLLLCVAFCFISWCLFSFLGSGPFFRSTETFVNVNTSENYKRKFSSKRFHKFFWHPYTLYRYKKKHEISCGNFLLFLFFAQSKSFFSLIAYKNYHTSSKKKIESF